MAVTMGGSLARRTLRVALIALLACGAAFAALQLTLGPTPAGIHVRWAAAATDAVRTSAERRYSLIDGRFLDARTWEYTLNDTSRPNVTALVGDPMVEDTSEIDRVAFVVRPESTRGREPLASHPRRAAILRIVTLLCLVVGLVALGVALIERVAPGAIRREGPWPRGRIERHGRRYRVTVLVLLGALAAIDLTSMRHLTLTSDEPEHLQYGQQILRLDATRFDDSKMPISALNAVPGFLAARLPAGRLASWLERPESGRYATVLFSLLVALCVCAWARDLYGSGAGLLALALYVFDPNMLAHSQLITTDVYAAGTTTFALYAFWRYLHRGGWPLLGASGLLVGVAAIAKYTAVVLLPLFAMIAVLFHLKPLVREIRERRRSDLRRRTVVFSGAALVVVVLSLCVVNIGFLFDRTLTSLDQYALRSEVLRTLQASSGVLGRLPLPVPYPYLEGLDLVIEHERTGSSFGPIYLLGELREDRGFPGYYFYACLYKMPLATQLLLLAAGAALVARARRFDLLRNESVLLVPVLFFTIYFNFFYRAQIGIRYFLVVMPLLYVLAGSLLAHARPLTRPAAVALSAVMGGLIVSVLSYYPHFLPYMNALVWDRTQAYTILADSNIDWGQDGWYLRRYLEAHPAAIVEPDGPTAGTVLVHVNQLTGVTGGPERFAWLRDHMRPVGQVAYAVLVYRVSEADLARFGLRR